jgi:hypothetical protein
MGTHRTESIAGVLARGVAAGAAFVAPPQLRPWTENQRLSRKRPSAGTDNPTKNDSNSTRRMHRNVFRGQYWRRGGRPAKSNFRFGRWRLFRARSGTTAMARTPALPEAAPAGALSAQGLNRSRGRGGERRGGPQEAKAKRRPRPVSRSWGFNPMRDRRFCHARETHQPAASALDR